MAKFKYTDITFVGSDGTVSLRIGSKTNPVFELSGIIPNETIIESDNQKIIAQLERDSKYQRIE